MFEDILKPNSELTRDMELERENELLLFRDSESKKVARFSDGSGRLSRKAQATSFELKEILSLKGIIQV